MEKIKENVGMNWWSMGTRWGWGMFVNDHMSNIHKPHLHTYPYMWCLEKLPIRVGALHLHSDWFSEVQIIHHMYMYVVVTCGCWTYGRSWTPTSLPCPHTFSPVHPYIFFNFFLLCAVFLWLLYVYVEWKRAEGTVAQYNPMGLI